MVSLLQFVFPRDLLHPMSTGRLYAYALYGPLDDDGALGSGRRGSHRLARWELDAMCEDFEREDVLRVYFGSEGLALLSKAEKNDVLREADVKAKTGKGLLPQVTRQEVIDILKNGGKTFPDLQRAITQFRDERLDRMKGKNSSFSAQQQRGEANCRPKKKIVPLMVHLRKHKVARKKYKGILSNEVAPSEMFQKNEGLSNHQIASETNKLLSVRAFQLCANLGAGNSLELTANVRLLRQDQPQRFKAGDFDLVTRTLPHQKALTEARLNMRALLSPQQYIMR